MLNGNLVWSVCAKQRRHSKFRIALAAFYFVIKHKQTTHHAFNRVKSIQYRIKLNFISENDVDVMPELLLLVFFVIDVMIEAEA